MKLLLDENIPIKLKKTPEKLISRVFKIIIIIALYHPSKPAAL